MGETGFGAGSGPASAPHSVVYGAASLVRSIEITIANVKVSLSEPSNGSGDITLSYTLTNPREDDASIVPEYSTNNRATWNTATAASGSTTTPKTTSTAGTAHTFIWDTVTDLGIDHKGDVWVRIRAYDLPSAPPGDYDTSLELILNVDNAPLAPTWVYPDDGWFDKDTTFSFRCTIPDPSEGNSDMHVMLELDTVDTFDSANLLTFESRLAQTGWEYKNASDIWTDIPHDGIPVVATPALIGNEVRFTVQTPDQLPLNSYEARWKFGGVTS